MDLRRKTISHSATFLQLQKFQPLSFNQGADEDGAFCAIFLALDCMVSHGPSSGSRLPWYLLPKVVVLVL